MIAEAEKVTSSGSWAELVDRVDRRDVDFVTLDPVGSTDLDQALALESSGSDLILRYAIADVGAFVRPGGAIDTEAERGADRIDMPEQEVVRRDGAFMLRFQPRRAVERQGAAMSLATNMAVADALFAAGTGLFRTMPAVDDRGVRRLRHTAQAFGLDWPGDVPLDRFEPTLDPDDPRTAAFQLAVRRASGKASYEPFRAGVVPWHAAVAATSTHATPPLRRLADRFVVEAAVSVAADRPSRTRPGRSGRVDARRVDPGDEVWVRLVRVDVGERRVEFGRVA